MSKSNALRLPIVIVGQTPPPYHGQGIMIQYLVEGSYRALEVTHVRMDFSKSLRDIGRLSLNKFTELFGLVKRVWAAKRTTNARILYYPPGSPNLVPVLRDIIFLLSVRWMFSRTVFHFHAGGLGEYLKSLPFPLRQFAISAYCKPDLALVLAGRLAEDVEIISPRKTCVLPNGIPDVFASRQDPASSTQNDPSILFMGMLSKAKGVADLLKACALLKERGRHFQCLLAGSPSSDEEYRDLQNLVDSEGLSTIVHFTGPVVGEEKWNLFATSDIFCFPSFYASEAFPVVLLEAMMFSLPVVSSRWRAIPEIVDESTTGFLVEPHDVSELAEKLDLLISDKVLRARLGKNGRQRYIDQFRVECYRHSFESALLGLIPN